MQHAAHLHRLHTQLQRAQETPYYQRLFAELSLDPMHLTAAELASLPITLTEAVRHHPAAFVRATAQPTFRATTSGTTGKPAAIFFSEAEMQRYGVLAAQNLETSGAMCAADVVQISTSARATLPNMTHAGACEHLGALWYQTGLVEPMQALAQLRERHHLPGKKAQASHLITYPSYLGLLVECALAAGWGPDDFGLEHIALNGELVSHGLKVRAQRVFGPVSFHESYATTESWPASATVCELGNLHFEHAQAWWEVIELGNQQAAPPGAVGSLVVTPLPPYRTTTLLVRYDTEDLVRTLVEPCACSLHHLPATSTPLGKLKFAVRHDQGWTFSRQVIEALEAIDAVPLPARWGYWAVVGGVAVEVVVRTEGRATHRAIEAALRGQEVPVRAIHLVSHAHRLQHPMPLRCDLRELAFPSPTRVGSPAPVLPWSDGRALLLRAKG